MPSAFYNGTRTNNYLTWANIRGGIVSLTINFNKATTAFGFDYFDTDVTDSYQINLLGGDFYKNPPFAFATFGGGASTGFFGLTSTTSFTSVVITNGAGSVVGGVPEPTTWALLVGGFGLVGVAARRRRTVVAA